MQSVDASRTPIKLLGVLFLCSGMAALMYQVSWQRILFSAFGADMESVAIVVSAFMLGLGGGALLGGWAADRIPKSTLWLFAVCEVGIGAYGFISLCLMRWAGDYFVLLSLGWIALVNFALVLVPALLMGATLPILVSHVARKWESVGAATGHMYAMNTMGAAGGALLTSFLLFKFLTLEVVVYIAAVINFAVAGVALSCLGSNK
ncbi:hypothetical protein SAMN03159475_1154 [Pseudomonas sp. NFPP33]|nr:hypothetical protein [Pseudomonas sp. NFPP33]SDA51332.1 hypothetical protein SAMN03159475_1154 [Pseudomonas sp. NFPP33]